MTAPRSPLPVLPGASPVGLEPAALSLADVLERENAALKTMNFAAATALLAAKNAALESFALAQRLAPNAPETNVRRMAEGLQALAAENRRLLERAMLVQGRVIGTIARAAPRAAAASPTEYGRTGMLACPGAAPAVALLARA